MSDEQMNDCACNQEATQDCACNEEASKDCACTPEAPKDCACAPDEPSITIPISYCGKVDVTIGTAELEEWLKERCSCDCDCEGDGGGGEEPGPDPGPEPVKDQFAISMHTCMEARLIYHDICKTNKGYALCGNTFNAPQSAKGLVSIVNDDLELIHSIDVSHSSVLDFIGNHQFKNILVAGGQNGIIVGYNPELIPVIKKSFGSNFVRGFTSDGDYLYGCGLESDMRKSFVCKYDEELNIVSQCNIPFTSQRSVYGTLTDIIIHEDSVIVCGPSYQGLIVKMDKELDIIKAIGSYCLTSRNTAQLTSISKFADGYLVVGITSNVANPSKSAVWVLDNDLNVVKQKGYDFGVFSASGSVLPNGNFVILWTTRDTPERKQHPFLMEITTDLEMVQNISLHANLQNQTSWMDKVVVEDDGSVVFGSAWSTNNAYVARIGGDWSKFEGQIEQYPDWYLTVDPEPGTFETTEVVLREWDFDKDNTISKENSNVTYTFEPSSLYDI